MVVRIYFLVRFLGVILAIPFFTLVERKLLRYSQTRKGPNKVGPLGLAQPISDGVKLIIKEGGSPTISNSFLFWLSPVFGFVLMVLGWLVVPSYFGMFSLKLGIVFLVCISSLKVYSLLGSGWGSNSKYSLLGSIRGASQVVSYEVCFIFIFFFPCVVGGGYKFLGFYKNFGGFFFLCVLLVFWLVCIVAETNRAPFDFAEGERELVSGFNTEYRSLGFALLFLGEYGFILVLSFVTSLFFCSFHFLMSRGGCVFISLFFIWFRSSFPRFRYDFLMSFAWVGILPCITLFLFFLLGFCGRLV